MLDAGGGTVDGVTYTVGKDTPLRLKTEEVVPGGMYAFQIWWFLTDRMFGELCGSSYINERFELLLIERLKHERYLEKYGDTLRKIIDGLVVEFERRDKKKFDTMFPNSFTKCTVKIPGLIENRKRRFMNGRMELKE